MNKILIGLVLLGGGAGAWWWYQQSQGLGFFGDPLPVKNTETPDILGIGAALNNVFGAGSILNTQKSVKNNNPTNIKYYSPINWSGQLGGDENGYAIFDTAQNGLKAAAKNLISYLGAGYNTPRKIAYRWSSGDPQTTLDNYASVLANRCNVLVDDRVSSKDLGQLLDGIVYFEQGYQPYSQQEIYTAVSRASGG